MQNNADIIVLFFYFKIGKNTSIAIQLTSANSFNLFASRSFTSAEFIIA